MRNQQGMPVKWDGDDGDAMLWAGLMVAVGDKTPIAGIKACQSADGRLWRSPARVNNQKTSSFSRDMSLGFILYFQETKDHDMANKWIKYIIQNGNRLFPDSEATDSRNVVTWSLWWIMSYAGMKVPLKYRLSRWILKPWQRLELKYTPRGYQRHLKAVSGLILAKANGKRDTKLGKALHELDPKNPFFAWMAGYNLIAASLTNDLYMNWLSDQGTGKQWSWERADYENAWKNAMGQDFDFMYRLLQLKIK